MAPSFLSRLGPAPAGKSPNGKGLSESDALRGRSPSPNHPRSRKSSTKGQAAPEFPKLTLTTDNDETMSIKTPLNSSHARADSIASASPSIDEFRKLSSADRRTMSMSAGGGYPVDEDRSKAKNSIGLGHPSNLPKPSSRAPSLNGVPAPDGRPPSVRSASPSRPLKGKNSKGAMSVHSRVDEDVAPPLPVFPNLANPPDRHQTMSSVHHARRDSTASATSTDDNSTAYQPMHTLTESPTALQHAYTDVNGLAPNGRDADAVSVRSGATDATGGSSKKKKTWRKTSNPKPTGLAGAIAASGLAMANPSMHRLPTSRSQASITSPQPRQAASASEILLSSNHAQSKNSLARGRGSRPSSANGRNGSALYENDEVVDSPVSDEDDSGSEDLDLDDDDIPVTGFAVASAKRNMDFHSLFPAVPEGDYLIEDYGCALQREILIQGRIYISENHVCFHANIFGWITDLIVPMYEVVSLEKKMTAFVIPNAIQVTTRSTSYTFASFMSRDTTYDVIHNIWRLARPDDAMSLNSGRSPRVSLDNGGSLGPIANKPSPGLGGGKERRVTQCFCGKEGKHHAEVAMDCILPGSPEKGWNLMFASGFVKNFLRVDQKLIDIQFADWEPLGGADSRLLARNMSYIKPLSGAIGPKQTKCELRDEMVHCDFDEHVTTSTTTRTPDVPSGGVFSVKTKTCITWATAASCRILVTTEVEWTGRSFIKSIIEKSCIDGQKTYHADLERGMRAYIAEHRDEFLEGLDIASEEATQLVETPLSPTAAAAGEFHALSEEEARKEREKERNTRAMQWAYDTFDGAYKVGKQSANTAIELIKDAWDHSSSTTILIFFIVALIFSNIYTLTRVGKSKEAGRRKERLTMMEKEKWVEGIVTALWDELSTAGPKDPLQSLPPVGAAAAGDSDAAQTRLITEVQHIGQMLDAIEERVTGLRNGLHVLTVPVSDAPPESPRAENEL